MNLHEWQEYVRGEAGLVEGSFDADQTEASAAGVQDSKRIYIVTAEDIRSNLVRTIQRAEQLPDDVSGPVMNIARVALVAAASYLISRSESIVTALSRGQTAQAERVARGLRRDLGRLDPLYAKSTEQG